MLALMIWLVAVAAHRALLTHPVIVSSRDVEDRHQLMAQGLAGDLLLGAAVSALVAAAGLAIGAAGERLGVLMLALSPWIVCLLVQDYWRAMAFNERRPGLALANDLVFAAVQGAALTLLLMLGWRSSPWIIAAWGLGATAGAVLGFLWFGAASSLAEGWHAVGRLWPLSRWMLADSATAFTSDQAYLAFVAFLLSHVDYGGFRAAASLMGPVIVILHAGANIGLPEASRRWDPGDPAALQRFARRLTTWTSFCIALYGTGIALGGRSLLRALYGPEFAHYDALAVLAALQYFIGTSAFGQEIALKAAGRMRRLWRMRLVVAGASLVSAAGFVWWLGTIGAGWAGVFTAAYLVAGVYLVYRAELGRPATTDRQELSNRQRKILSWRYPA
jgi:O-antigen/teichoic acid export membrane protein